MPTTQHKPSGACPSHFRASCHEAMMGREDYSQADYQLVSHVASLGPDDMEDDAWSSEVESLLDAILGPDDSPVLAWFDRWLPRCMALVPAGNRDELLEGVYRAVIEEEMDILDP